MRRMACKPGSVPAPKGDGWPFVWDVRCRTPRATYPKGTAETHPRPETAGPSYSVLLPVGFTLPPPSPEARCALTAPFHPYQPSLKRRRAVFFLWHYPWGRPRRVLPGTVFPWSPDFPPLAGFPIARSSHPAIRRMIIIGTKQPPAKAVKNRKQHTY